MARHRTIKPEFCTSEQIVECSRDARLLFVLLWMFCDDGGVHQASVKKLKMECFPGDDLTVAEVEKLVAELIGQGLLREFEADGQKWWNVTGWHHQKIDRPTYLHPFSRELGEQAFITRQTRGERSASDRREDAEPAAMDRARVEQSGVEKKGEEQKRKEGRGGERKRPVAASAKRTEEKPAEQKRAESTGAAESGAESKREESKPAEQRPAADHRESASPPSGVDTAKGPAGGTGGSLGGGAVRAGSAAPVPVSNSPAGSSCGRDLLIPERIDSPVMRDMWPVYVDWRRERGMDCGEVQLLKILGQINTELIAEPAGRAAAMAVDCLGMAMDRSWNWVFPKHVIKAEREREKREKEAAAGQAAADQQREAYELRKAQERLEIELAGVIRQLRQQKRSDAEITEQLYASGVFPPEFLAAAGWKRESLQPA